jgi:hypothetical protein
MARRTRQLRDHLRPNDHPHPAAALFAPSLILLAPLLNFLSFHDYGLTRPETGILLGSCLALGLLLGAATFLGGRILRWLVLSGTIAFTVDAQVGESDESRVFWISLGVALCVGWFLRSRLTGLTATVFGALVIGNVVLPVGQIPHGERREVSDYSGPSHLSPVVHLLLDGHLGIEGIPTDTEDGRRLKSELQAFYAKHGFRLYGKAYSRFENTYNALGNVLNFEAQPLDRYQWERGSSKHVLKRNRVFRNMADRGYAIRVYQSTYRNFCRAENVKITSCYTYAYPGIKELERAALTPFQKAAAITISFANRSAVYRGIRTSYLHRLRPAAARVDWKLPAWDWDGASNVGPLFVPDLFAQMRSDILKAPDGYLFFAHLVFPHEPYVFGADCQLKPSVRSWLPAWSPMASGTASNTPETRAAAYRQYHPQLRCAAKQLGAFFEAMRTAGIYDRTTIILHGDHGSRISIHRPKLHNEPFLTHDDFVDSFSTLFAVRSPKFEPGYDLRLLPVETLLESAIGNGETDSRTDPIEEPYVLMFTQTRKPMLRRPMIDFGAVTTRGGGHDTWPD